jgi:cellulose 1,4-beta-cellobiosidase
MKGNIAFVAATLLSASAAMQLPEPTTLATEVASAVRDAWAPEITQSSQDIAQGRGNPFKAGQLFANPYYSSEVISIAIPSLSNKALAAKASTVAKVPSFFWM